MTGKIEIEVAIGCRKCHSIREKDVFYHTTSEAEFLEFMKVFFIKVKECAMEWNKINGNNLFTIDRKTQQN